jgi:Ca2+-binding RTX toxin-like protein
MAIYDYSSAGLNTVLDDSFDAASRANIQAYLSGEGAFTGGAKTEVYDGSTIPEAGVEVANITSSSGNVFATGDLEAVVLNSDSNGTLNVTNNTGDDLGVFTADGDNTLNLTAGSTGQGFYVDAGAGNDTIFASTASDTVFGGAGDDAIYGGGGGDSLLGGMGNDTITGGVAADTIYGGDGNDQIFGEGGNDTIFGGIGNDTIFGGAGDDVLRGEGGNDVFSVKLGDGEDTIYGGDGVDTVSFGLAKSTDADIYFDETTGITYVTIGGQDLEIHEVEKLKFRDGTFDTSSFGS